MTTIWQRVTQIYHGSMLKNSNEEMQTKTLKEFIKGCGGGYKAAEKLTLCSTGKPMVQCGVSRAAARGDHYVVEIDGKLCVVKLIANID